MHREAILQRNAREDLPIPDGFNIGVNVGESAGQTVFHLHVHVIPRFRGDVPDPRGGVRHVLPQSQLPRDRTTALDSSATPDAPLAEQLPTDRPRPAGDGRLDDALLRPLLDDLDAAHQVDIAVAFVLESGVELIAAHLREVLERGGAVRFLTGDYMDATDPRALRRLLDLEGNIQRRVFESTRESFHPKAYIFTRRSGQRGGVRRQLQPHQPGI